MRLGMQDTKYICYQESDTALIKKTALAIFKSMILPYLEYGNIVYGTCSEFNKYKLQVIQNNGLKIALNRNVLYSIQWIYTLKPNYYNSHVNIVD